MIHDKNVIENRNNLLTMLALTEEIIRTNQRIHSLISNLMNSQNEGSNIKSSIEDLYKKVVELKKFNVKLPLIEEEKVLVPGPEDASLPEDPDYVEPTVVKTPEPVKTPELQETKETLEDRELRIPRKARVPRKNPRRQPNKPLSNTQ
tara:strand:- start:3 stop:446 length:444 start_codon:yes stop_codon:yes gene_type:complete